MAHWSDAKVVRGFKQRQGIDFNQSLSPVVKPATIWTVLHLVATWKWPIQQLDVKNAFLHGDLVEQVYCLEPADFIDADHPDCICLLSKSLYGLKQAPRAWYQRFSGEIKIMGFTMTHSNSSLFVYKHNDYLAYLLL
jgi:hypothetical protein